MGSVFRKMKTKPLPEGAEVVTRRRKVTVRQPDGTKRVEYVTEQCARWQDAKGKSRVELVTTGEDGSLRLRLESGTYFAKYRDHDGTVRVVPTGCRDEANARQCLADLEKQTERVHAGVVTPDELAIADRKLDPLERHLTDYLSTLTGSAMYRDDIERYVHRLAADCGWTRLADLKRFDLEKWLADQSRPGPDGRPIRSARSRNAYREAMVCFCNWCVTNHRMPANPFDKLPKAKVKTDPRRQRRALTEAEVARLLDVAMHRPVRDALRVNRGPRKGQLAAKLTEERRLALEAVGRFRVIVYRTLLATGMRMGELAQLTVGDLQLDGPVPYMRLRASTTKNSEEADLPLRADLAAALRTWLHERFGPGDLSADGLVFDIPTSFLKVFNRDLVAAGIQKRDERKRTVDLHALRTTFGTMLSKSGVPPRVAQQLMRHSDIRLTMGVYTDPKLFDLQGAVEALPSVAPPSTGRVAPGVAPTTVNLVQPESSDVISTEKADSREMPVSKPKRRIS
jgi:integrase